MSDPRRDAARAAPDAERRRAARAGFGVAFAALAALRVALCFQVPLETTDAYRNLGYARHAFELEPSVYASVAADYAPETWTAIWSDQGFIYGPVVLVFFWVFGWAGLGLVHVKLALGAVDLVVAALFARRISPWAGLFYFAAPIGLHFVSREGEHESLQTLWIALAAIAVQSRRWGPAGACFALAVQTKAFGVLLLPWIALEWWREPSRAGALAQLAAGGALATLPFAFFYLQEPLLLLHPLRRGIDFAYNPFAWNVLDRARFLWNPPWLVAWNAIFSGAALAAALVFTWRQRRQRDAHALAPFLLFWLVTKSLRWAQFWYPIAAPGFLFCLERRRKAWVLLLLALHAAQCARSATLLVGPPYGFVESALHRAQMRACLYHCPAEPARAAPLE
jgi:hypothetical protein